MLVTSAQAAKLLRQLNDELRALQLKEANSCSFVAAIQEDVESVQRLFRILILRSTRCLYIFLSLMRNVRPSLK